MTTLVFFDLDGTLIDNPSSEKRFIFHLLKKGYFGWRQVWASFVFTLKWIWRFKLEIVVKNKGYLAGLPIDKINSLGTAFAKDRLLPLLRPHIASYIDEHQKQGDLVILLTGSPNFIADVFAKKCGINEVLATLYATNSHFFLNQPPLQHPYGEEKLKIAQAACRQHNVDIKTTVAYGNSIHDRAILEACGTPIAVTPDRRLRRMAKTRGWRILENHHA